MLIMEQLLMEKRRDKRSDLNVSVKMRRCDNHVHKKFTVEVHDLSRNGIGFYSTDAIKSSEYYDAEIVIWTKEAIKVVIKIVRRTVQPGKKYVFFGGEFIGLSENEKFRIDVYQCVKDNLKS
jgi:hypothetical protein